MPTQHCPPLNTGKVRIGCAYQPKPNVHHDSDALRLQRALLGERTRLDWSGVGIVVFALVALALVLSAGGRP